MSDSMAEIMAADEKVDALPEIGVMDLYVRSKFMKALMEKYGSQYNGFNNGEFKKGENALMNYNMDGVRTWAANAGTRGVLSKWAANEARDNRAEDYIVAVFNRITNDDWSHEKTVSVARAYLKDYLKGSMGMPDDRVIRENLKNYDGDE